MTITLHGRLTSVNVQKVVWALGELGLTFEHVPRGGSFGRLTEPDYLALNPNGKVPTLVDGDVVIWESHAIVRYLAATYGAGTLWPTDPRTRAAADQWTDWTATTFQQAWLSVFEAVIRTPQNKQDPALIARAKANAERHYAMLDKWLAGRRFIGGEGLSYADIVAGASMFRWMTMPIARPSMPNLEAWYSRLEARPAFRTGVCVSYEDMIGVPPTL